MSKQVWSKNRPIKPDSDPLLKQIVPLLQRDNRSNYAKANVSGLSPTTFRNWTRGKVKHPQAVSVAMAARMLGYELKLVRK